MILPLLQSLILDKDLPFFESIVHEPSMQIEISVIPIKSKKEIEPVIEAQSAIVMDVDSHEILYSKNINEKRAFASIAKLMVASIIIEGNDLNEITTVNTGNTDLNGGRMWLIKVKE